MKKKTITLSPEDFPPLVFEYLPENRGTKDDSKMRVLEAVKKLQPCIRSQVQREIKLGEGQTKTWLKRLVDEGLLKRRMAIVHLKNTSTIAPIYTEPNYQVEKTKKNSQQKR